jgi:hypothetical protein
VDHIVGRHGDEFAEHGLVADDLADADIAAAAGPAISLQRTFTVHLVIVRDRVVRVGANPA